MGFMGACPIAGVVWQHIHYIVGLQRLGHEVFYIEDSARITYNPETFDVGEDYLHAARILSQLAEKYGFQDRWAFRARYLPEMPTAGLSSEKIRELYKSADAILNICGSQELNEDLLVSSRLLYIESDPGVEQIKIDQNNAETREYLERHAKRFTFGECIGTPDFPVPLHGLEWLPTRQPVVTDFWKSPQPEPYESLRFSSIANWSTSGKKDITWNNDTYLWSKSREFLRFISAPANSNETFTLATDIPDQAIRDNFSSYQWELTSPHQLSADFDRYRSFIQNSKGEFTVAKDQYVRLHTGWFSDRSACYLAAGRPVITQETGFSKIIPCQGGLFPYSNLAEIRAATLAIHSDYSRHCRLAFEIAKEFFEAETVVHSLLTRAGI